MPISINYSISARDVLTHPEMPQRLQWMKDAGVERLWLFGYFYGHHESSPEQMLRARIRLEDEGFQTGVISLPVGHPGNSLNPDDPALDLAIHPDWHYRQNADGQKQYFCACVDDVLIAHNRAAALEYAQMGFTHHFFDDDLRLGSPGPKVQGCFCDHCIDRFNQQHGLQLSRGQLKAVCDEAPGTEELRELWVQFNCDKITKLMRDTQAPGMTSGIMVMVGGARQHGISIPDIRRAVAGCMFRVGECHFSEKSYMAPGGQEALKQSVREHLRLIGNHPAYSESTVFPAEAMEPETFLHRIRLEISLGLRNIFLMSGTHFFSERYWRALAATRSELNDLADQS